MDIDNPFDSALEAQKRMPEHIRDGAIESVDTLDLAWAGVRAVFGDKATAELALALLPVILARADAARLRRSELIGGKKASGS